MRWTIVVPLKALPAAKSRLAAASDDPQRHAALVDAIRADTLEVARSIARVLVVVDRSDDRPSDGLLLVQTRPGLNEAVREATAHAHASWPGDGVAALVGDLPALTAGELAAALELASAYPRSFVADESGTGTTLLAATAGADLAPAFGAGSAARHGLIATELPAGPGLRLDVDTASDLERALALGVGPATTALLGL